MAKILRIATEDSADYYDLLDGSVKATLNSYYENMTPDGLLERRFGLVGKYNASTNTRIQIMEAFKTLEDFGRRAAEWHTDPSKTQSIWLEETAEDEVPYKRALIYSIEVNRIVSAGIGPLLNTSNLLGEIAIVTTPFHESRVATKVTGSGIDLDGGMLAIPSGATYNGRLASLKATNTSATPGKFWVGIRPINHGVDEFDPVLDFALANTGYQTDTSRITSSFGLNGYYSQTTFATVATLEKRQQVKLSQFHPSVTNYNHFVGEYTAVIALKGSVASDVFGIQLQHGLTFNEYTVEEEVYIETDTTQFVYYPIGKISIPGTPYRRGLDLSIDDYYFALYAERISGSGYLLFDAIILIPSKYQSVATPYGATNSDYYLKHFENDEPFAYFDGTSSLELASIESSMAVPADGGKLVFLETINKEGGRLSTPGSGSVALTLDIYNRFGRYAGNG